MITYDIQQLINSHSELINSLYPQYHNQTIKNFKIISEMLLLDYDEFSSDGKKFRYIIPKIEELVTNAFTDIECKNYLKRTIDFFYLKDIEKFFHSSLKTSYVCYKSKMDSLKSRIIYWQGYEGLSEKHLRHLLEPFDQ